MARICKIVVFQLLLMLLFTEANAQSIADKVKAHQLRFQETQVPLSESFIKNLDSLQVWLKSPAAQKPALTPYYELLDQYLTFITPTSYRKYAFETHEDIIEFTFPLYQFVAFDPNGVQGFLRSNIPDAYQGIKIIVPSEVALEPVMEFAENNPGQLIGLFSQLDYANDDRDLQAAVLRNPVQVKQFLHFQNNVKRSLDRSSNDTIKLLLDIYKKYRFSANSYYLLPYVKSGQLSIEKAEELGKNQAVLMDYIARQLLKNDLLGKASLKEKWDETMGGVITKIKKQKSLPVNQWVLNPMEDVSDTTRIISFILGQGLMDAREMDAYMRWISLRHFLKPFDAKMLDPFPLRQILQLKDRIQQQQLTTAWGQLWGKDTLKTYIAERKAQEANSNIYSKNDLSTFKTGIPDIKLPTKTSVPEFFIPTYHFNLSQDEKDYIKWSNDPLQALEKVKDWLEKPYAGKLLLNIAKQYPLEIIAHLNDIKLKAAGIEALKSVGKEAPLTAKNFILKPDHPWTNLFAQSKDSVIKTLFKINTVAGINTRAYLLLDDIYRGKISILEADSICRYNQLLIPRLLNIVKNPSALGRYSVEQELSAKALNFVRNYNISENTDQYYAGQLKELSADQIYAYITYGEDEIIERTFLKMFSELLVKSPNGNLYHVMQNAGFNQFRKFIRKCAFYNVTDKMLSGMESEQRKSLANQLIAALENESETECINVAEIFLNLQSREFTGLLHSQLRTEYERCEKAKADKGVAVYGILSAILSEKIDNGWARYVAKKYELPSLNTIPAYDLFNQDLANIQQYYFYKDEDGISSYNNFIRSYQKSPLEWEIKDLGKFVLIKSRVGQKVEIYANKATEGELGIDAMLLHMKNAKLEPQVVVHRGLSTHTLKTFSRIPNNARLILDGSCGGYHVQQVAIDRAPSAQILCNRNIGTMHVNDPIFKQISDDIRSGKDLDWPDFWEKMRSRVGSNPYFKDYIPPHKNAGVILYKALYDVLEIN